MSLNVARPDATGTAKTGRRVLLQVIGLQRSGNHAIIGWLSSLFERPVHLNDLPHDFFCRTENVTENPAFAKAGCCILSFEDTRRPGAGPLLNVGNLDSSRLSEFDCHVVYLLRDPYNLWASRVKAKEAGKLTCSARLEPFMREWTDLARLCVAQPDAFILYNSWFGSQAYRRQVCARLGGRYSERTLGEVTGAGGGSSFDGASRPSIRTILGNLGYYRSAAFRRRLFRQPGSYLARLFLRSVDGRQLQVDRRWQYLAGREEAQALFANAEVQALSREIFGFHVDAAGQRVVAPADAGVRLAGARPVPAERAVRP